MQQILEQIGEAIKQGQDAFGTFAKSLDADTWGAIGIGAVILIVIVLILGSARRKNLMMMRIEALEAAVSARPAEMETGGTPWVCGGCKGDNEADAIFCKHCGKRK